MHTRTAVLALASALLVSCAHRQSEAAWPLLAVEFPEDHGPVWRLPVPPDGGVGTELTGDSLRPRPGTDTHTGPPVTLSLGFTARGDKVTATVYTIPPESDPLRWSDGHKRLLGSWSARLNETIEIKELKKFGYQSLVLKIVQAAPPSPPPSVISRAPSIKIAPVPPNHRFPPCVAMLHNTSSSAVLAYATTKGADLGPGTRAWGEVNGSPRSPAIAPRGDACDHDGEIIAAAVFSDGSYEGDPRFAARLSAKEIGQAAVNRLVTSVIDGIIRDQSLNDDVRTARIKEEIFRIQPDRAAARALRLQFPHVPAKDLAEDLTQGFDFAKDSIWGSLYGYMHKCCEYPPPDHVSLSEWWRIEDRGI